MSAARHTGLGRGLGALIKNGVNAPAEAPAKETGITRIPVSAIAKNTWQPRRTFQADSLAELTASVKEHGVLQPLLVRAAGADFELIAGERRLRAAIAAGIEDVPVIVMVAADVESLELALIENLQREDLNVLEEAEGYRALADKFEMTQEQIAAKVGKARASVANTMRILGLPAQVRQYIAGGQLSAGHAKALTGLEIEEERVLYAERAVKDNLSVRAIENLIRRATQAPRKPRATRPDIPTSHLTSLSDQLHTHFGTQVRITPSRTYANGKKAKGCIEIDFYSNDDLDRILSLLSMPED